MSTPPTPPPFDVSSDTLTILRESFEAAQAAVSGEGGAAPAPGEHVAFARQSKVGPVERVFHIYDGVFLGSEFGAVDEASVVGCGFTLVINATAGSRRVPNAFEDRGIKYVNLELHDHVGENPVAAMETAVKELDACKAAGGRALVHCSAGLSRSATLVLAYLMTSCARSLADAVAVANAGRGRPVQLNASFWTAVWQLEKRLHPTLTAPTLDFTPWVVEDLTVMGFDAETVAKALVDNGYDATATLEMLLG